MNTYLTFVHALSPLHAGTGQGVGIIDLPIAREKATDLPYLPGSSVKGTLRGGFSGSADEVTIFGSSDDHAGSAQFSDQRLLLLPIRSLAGTFAWVTSPYLLRRFGRDAHDCGLTARPGIPDFSGSDVCYIAEEKTTKKEGATTTEKSALPCTIGKVKLVVLEDLDLKPTEHTAVRGWATLIGEHVFPNDSEWQAMLAERFCLVHDDVLRFLLETATEVLPRIRLLDDKKTVADGGFWYEEALPTETILTGLLALTPTRQALLKLPEANMLSAIEDKTARILQFGGKATVGRGLCRVRIARNGQGSQQNGTAGKADAAGRQG